MRLSKMTAALMTEVTLDDLIRAVFEEILNNGDEIKPTKVPPEKSTVCCLF